MRVFVCVVLVCVSILNGQLRWGLAEVDIMNQAELIYDNSCLLSFVCLTYNLTIAW